MFVCEQKLCSDYIVTLLELLLSKVNASSFTLCTAVKYCVRLVYKTKCVCVLLLTAALAATTAAKVPQASLSDLLPVVSTASCLCVRRKVKHCQADTPSCVKGCDRRFRPVSTLLVRLNRIGR